MNLIHQTTRAMYRHLAMRHRHGFCTVKTLRHHTVEADGRFWNLYLSALKEDTTVQPFEDFYNLYQLVLKTRKLPGDIAELGVFRGGTAKLIATLEDKKDIHLFDTFAGMPAIRPDVDTHHRAGDFGGDWLGEVQRYLKDFKNIFFHKGLFPDSASELAKGPITFSFVHLDADIYESTKAGLEFFYPRTVRGGIIVSHDYRSVPCPGVKRAYDEFFADKPEPVIELWKTQCLMVKQ